MRAGRAGFTRLPWTSSGVRVEGSNSQDHPPREVEGELGVEVANQPKATSAASSRAFRRFLPSYQKRAVWTTPYTVTRLDQAVRPPISAVICQIQPSRSMKGSRSPSGPPRRLLTSSIREDLEGRSLELPLGAGLCIGIFVSATFMGSGTALGSPGAPYPRASLARVP